MTTDLCLARFGDGAASAGSADGDSPSDESADGDVPSAPCGGRWWLGDTVGVLSAAAPAACTGAAMLAACVKSEPARRPEPRGFG